MTTLPFTPQEYELRLDGVRERVDAAGLDGLVVTTPENITYLTGFSTPGYHVFQALVVPDDGDPFLVLRDIEVDNVRARSHVQNAYALQGLEQPARDLERAVKQEGLGGDRLGIETESPFLPPAAFQQLIASQAFVAEPTQGIVEEGRKVKSAAEIALIETSVAMAEQAMLAAVVGLEIGTTDSQLAGRVLARLAELGSEYTGSPPYVVAGPASATSHALHARRPLEHGDHAWLEISASRERYHGAVSRIATVGDPSTETMDALEASTAAIDAMVAMMRPGVSSGEVDRAGREAADATGQGQYWRNRAAYALGISYPPGLGEGHIMDLKPDDQRPLRTGMVFHLIPIMKVPGVGAVGCTETVVVTEDGGRCVSSLPRTSLDPTSAHDLLEL